MDWKITGEYFMGCTCTSQVHWPIDGSMRDSNGACESISVFRISEGFYWESDLSGVKFAVLNVFPAKLSTSSWVMGIIVDEEASPVQEAAIEAMMRGVEGGPMTSLRGMIGEYMGTDRGGIGYLDGESLFGAIEGRGSFTYKPSLVDGKPVPAPSAMWTFADEYKVGRSQGRITAFGRNFALDYGEYGRFSFNNEHTGMEREFRPSRITGVYGRGNLGKP